MSILGAMNTAITGLNAQSDAFGNISDNIANSQTVGYKDIGTNFQDFLTSSTATQNQPGSVVALPDYQNSVQGTITQTTNPLGLAIAGQGFFAVSEQSGTQNGQVVFNPQQYYTRDGNFSMNSQGYLVNDAGEYLQGWPVNPTTGVANQTQIAPIQISQNSYNPVATTQMTLAANLPATPAGSAPVASQIQVYDALGQLHAVNLTWTQTSLNNWSVSIQSPDANAGAPLGTANVVFGTNGVPAGTIGSISGGTGTVTTSAFAANAPATLSFTANFGNGNQTIQLGMGTYGSPSGVTQYAGTQYSVQGISQNGVAAGSFSSVTVQNDGSVTINYNNGQARTIAQVPIVTFNAPDALQRQDGQAFTATLTSGTANAQVANTNGAGNLVTGSVESSSVDIATEFNKLIVAQQAYTAGTKVVTTAQQMLTSAINMVQ